MILNYVCKICRKEFDLLDKGTTPNFCKEHTKSEMKRLGIKKGLK